MSALKLLFEHRLDSDPLKARSEWLDIVESRSLLWGFISSPKRELVRSVLNTINVEIVKRARPPNVFDFASASVGNMFLAGYALPTPPLAATANSPSPPAPASSQAPSNPQSTSSP